MGEIDLLVIGGGSGGLASARRAAGHGARVVVVEADRVGGTCVIRGCIPKKLMVLAAQLGRARALAADYGWAPPAPGPVDWAALCRARNGMVNNLELAHTRHLAAANVRLVTGRARLLGGGEVGVGDERLRARHILLAVGGTPVVPAFPGSREVACDSDGFFALPEMPRRAAIVGGGYIAVEFACLLSGLGSQVTLVARSEVLRGFDHDLREGMVAGMRHAGITVHLQTQVQGSQATAGGTVALTLSGPAGQSVTEVDGCVVTAVGRRPQTANLGVAAAGVTLGERGAIVVDDQHRTTAEGIYAVGDAIDRVNLTPMAIRAGRAVADGLFGGGAPPVDYTCAPTAVFGHPPLGTCGLSEAAARARLGDQVKIFRSRFVPLAYALAQPARKVTSTMKLVVDGATDRVLGVHVLGDDAPEIVQGFAAALSAGATKAQFDATLALHPTQAEELVLMR